ncbi:hypothetical protein ACRE_009190 [Hapsidospora chrysogenum ATCC 11550]|uniref:Uncharacterized protein n=1 Tax=Hapsidospora chrysogenum (strain ATCC 11550 / CBS 779.69 / DSM 880 / IAM 14645 / JCM 23072 / IMI 49137) TaxID=857340 RepID=A0A086TFW1_HAPC1|nr:hypothetical protein ACRE_009190 [Hapsidospora chrysogenum ATCC 11550]
MHDGGQGRSLGAPRAIASRGGYSVSLSLVGKQEPECLEDVHTLDPVRAHDDSGSTGNVMVALESQATVFLGPLEDTVAHASGIEVPGQEINRSPVPAKCFLTDKNRRNDLPPEVSSMYSQDSGETIIPGAGQETQLSSSNPSTPSRSITAIGPERDKDLALTRFECRPASEMPDEVSTPLAHFPWGRELSGRSDLILQILNGSGEYLNPEGSRQAQLGTADSVRSMIAEFQPSPLRLRRRPSFMLDNGGGCLNTLRGNIPDSAVETVAVHREDHWGRPAEEDNEDPTGDIHTPVHRRLTLRIDSSPAQQSGNPFFDASPDEPPRLSHPQGKRDKNGALPREPQHSPTLPDYEAHYSSSSESSYSISEAAVTQRYRRSGPPPPKVQPVTGEQLRPQSPRALLDIGDEDEIFTPRPSAATLRRAESRKSSFDLERFKSRDARTILPRSDARLFPKDDSSRCNSPPRKTSTPSSRPKHIPIVIDSRSSSLRSNMTTQERLSQARRQAARPDTPSPKEATEQRNVFSPFGTLFRRRNRDRRPKTPLTPSAHWNPFKQSEDEPPYSTSRAGGKGKDGTTSFKRRTKREDQERRSQGNSPHSGIEAWRRRRPSSRESLVDFRSVLNSDPIPPVPGPAAFRDKKPRGLAVETTMAHGLRKPQSTSSGLRTAFRRGARRTSMSKIEMGGEEED